MLTGVAPDDVEWAIIRQRSALLALVVTAALSMIVLGFATFFAGVRGEFNIDASSGTTTANVASSAPGVLFVLCGAVLLGLVVQHRIERSGGGISAAQAAQWIQVGASAEELKALLDDVKTNWRIIASEDDAPAEQDPPIPERLPG